MDANVIGNEGALGNPGEKQFRLGHRLNLPPFFGNAIDLSTGETAKQIAPHLYEIDKWEQVTNTYYLRSCAREILFSYRDGEGNYVYRVCKCGHMMNASRGVDVYRSLIRQSALFAGVITCGSVWHCPVCATKITLRRRAELDLGIKRHLHNGGVCALMTCTLPHNRTEKLAENMKKIQDVYRLLFSSRSGEKLRQKYNVCGQIRSIEITNGINGWHPHVHTILLMNSPQNFREMGDELYAKWRDAAAKKYGYDLPRIALDLRGGNEAANYITKWSLSHELTHIYAKKARQNESQTTWQLLALAAENNSVAREKWEEFATTVSRPAYEGNVKSTRQLVWSRGLKSHYDLQEKSDEKIAEEILDPGYFMGNLDQNDWQKIRAERRYDPRIVILQLAQTGSWQDVRDFVDSLPDPTHTNQQNYRSFFALRGGNF